MTNKGNKILLQRHDDVAPWSRPSELESMLLEWQLLDGDQRPASHLLKLNVEQVPHRD